MLGLAAGAGKVDLLWPRGLIAECYSEGVAYAWLHDAGARDRVAVWQATRVVKVVGHDETVVLAGARDNVTEANEALAACT